MIMQDSLTLSILGIIISILIIYDLFTVLERGSETTISVQLFEFSKKYPIVPFVLGIVFGHIFWPL